MKRAPRTFTARDREKAAIVRRAQKLLADGRPNPAYRPVTLRLAPEKRNAE